MLFSPAFSLNTFFFQVRQCCTVIFFNASRTLTHTRGQSRVVKDTAKLHYSLIRITHVVSFPDLWWPERYTPTPGLKPGLRTPDYAIPGLMSMIDVRAHRPHPPKGPGSRTGSSIEGRRDGRSNLHADDSCKKAATVVSSSEKNGLWIRGESKVEQAS